MMMIRLRQALAICLLALCSMAAGPLSAQTTSLPTPPQVSTVDDRGVDLLSMQFRPSDGFLSIGVPGQGGMSFGRVWFGDPISGHYGFLNNYIISMYTDGGTAVITMGGQKIQFPNHTYHYDST